MRTGKEREKILEGTIFFSISQIVPNIFPIDILTVNLICMFILGICKSI